RDLPREPHFGSGNRLPRAVDDAARDPHRREVAPEADLGVGPPGLDRVRLHLLHGWTMDEPEPVRPPIEPADLEPPFGVRLVARRRSTPVADGQLLERDAVDARRVRDAHFDRGDRTAVRVD